MLNALITRWSQFRNSLIGADADSSAPTQIAERPVDSFFQSLVRWVPGEPDPWRATAYRREMQRAQMPAARAEFEACLDGLSGEAIERLRRHIDHARCMSDLWHLRAGLYTEVARSHSQHEAEQRLARIRPLFPGQDGAAPKGKH